jgi:hypothetical protein
MPMTDREFVQQTRNPHPNRSPVAAAAQPGAKSAEEFTMLLSEVISELEASTEMLSELSDSHAIDQKIEEAEARFAPMRIIVMGFLEEPISQEEEAWGLNIYRLGFEYVQDPNFLMTKGEVHLVIKERVIQNPNREGVADNETSNRGKGQAIYDLRLATPKLRVLGLKRVPELLKRLKTEAYRYGLPAPQNSSEELSYIVAIDRGAHAEDTERYMSGRS